MEEWRTIADFPDYQVSNLGRVRTWRKRCNIQRDLPLYKQPCLHSKRGYYFVSLASEKGATCRDIHRLVAIAFLEPVQGKTTVDHINKDRLDNRVCNLRWANQTEQNINKYFLTEDHHIYTTTNNKINPWVVEFQRYGKRVYKKYFSSKEEAIRARDDFLVAENNGTAPGPN